MVGTNKRLSRLAAVGMAALVSIGATIWLIGPPYGGLHISAGQLVRDDAGKVIAARIRLTLWPIVRHARGSRILAAAYKCGQREDGVAMGRATTGGLDLNTALDQARKDLHAPFVVDVDLTNSNIARVGPDGRGVATAVDWGVGATCISFGGEWGSGIPLRSNELSIVATNIEAAIRGKIRWYRAKGDSDGRHSQTSRPLIAPSSKPL